MCWQWREASCAFACSCPHLKPCSFFRRHRDGKGPSPVPMPLVAVGLCLVGYLAVDQQLWMRIAFGVALLILGGVIDFAFFRLADRVAERLSN